ncbi:MAG TPA: GspE/PulE family protein [Candidatus Hydrogenedens sp.]|nr:GspE/PulE family protein [Candidatus Hydrogenedens sp.]HOK08271.1 GspE/PulE family protein [Candidatus Hydrogenedens sp.]HOL21037.1 GspE/PulE family protein [Candidatus Hydrogenedens sp.]HPP59138.1 GspE/PulE family protein [Candidatus Hydrogenedens sp.]
MIEPKGFEKFFVKEGIITEEQAKKVREEANEKGISISQILIQKGFVSEENIYTVLANYCGLNFVIVSKIEIPKDLIKSIPARFATHYEFIPIKEKNNTLVIAISDPLNASLLDDIRLVLKRKIEPVVTTPKEIQKAIKDYYGVGADTVERILVSEEHQVEEVSLEAVSVSANLGDETIDASIIKFVNELIAEAIRAEATDIHIEPFDDYLRVRFRIDGILHPVPVPPSIRNFHSSIVSRIKIMANLNIAEKRLPQDGKILANLGDGKYDLRVSILPTPHGETINIRILSRTSMFLSLDKLGFSSDDIKLFNSFITKPYGIILVTGPTGSGKTTTLYAALDKLNKTDRKIITIEDPIEYQMPGITQMQVHPRIGFDFATGLRSMLRHDPDIMLVGEIRDYETAEMAIRSSLTGHLVLSTLHTNDAPGAVTRLIDMGIEPFLISSTMIASMAQRLVRKICVECKIEDTPDAYLLEAEFGVKRDEQNRVFYKGKGCEHCRYTGYRGRMAICEIMPFTPTIKEMTVQRATSVAIKKQAISEGMKTLRASGWQRICEGLTTIEEVLRVTADAEIMEGMHASI